MEIDSADQVWLLRSTAVMPAKAGIHLDLPCLLFVSGSRKSADSVLMFFLESVFALCASHFSLNGKEK